MGEPEFEDDVAAFDVTEVAEPLSERIEERRSIAVCRRQNADARDLHRGLLRACPHRREKQYGEPGDHDAAPSHSITSSARARINGGIVRPSARAVFSVDDQFEPARLLDREVGGLGSLQDAINEISQAPCRIKEVRTIGQEPAVLGDPA